MLYGYMDETGHSSDESQNFNGMAGLLAQDAEWTRLEKKWKVTLKQFQIPFFHMKDFAHFRGHFEGWKEDKRQRLLGGGSEYQYVPICSRARPQFHERSLHDLSSGVAQYLWARS